MAELKRREKKTAPEIFAPKLEEYFIRYKGAIIAYSGGVDSALQRNCLKSGDYIKLGCPWSKTLCFDEYRTTLTRTSWN